MKKNIVILIMTFSMIAGILAFAGNSNLKVKIETGSDKNAVSDAKIELSSPALMKNAEAASDKNGIAIFYDLPMGTYVLTVDKDGFGKKTIENIKIGIKKRSRIVVYLSAEGNPSADESADFMFSDNFSSSYTSDYDLGEVYRYLPVPKNFMNILLLPGGVSGRDSVSTLGGGTYDNNVYLESINHTDPATQVLAFDVGVDYIQGINTYLTGIPVEYGYMNGGVSELITDGGSNKYHADAYLIMRRNEWNDTSDLDPSITTDDRREGSSGDSWLFSIGGFLWKDAAWWHLSYESLTLPQAISRRTNPFDATDTNIEEKKPDYDAVSFKGTFQPFSDLKGTVIYFRDNAKYYNRGAAGLSGAKTLVSADRSTEQIGEHGAVTFSYLLKDDLLLEGGWSYLRYDNNQIPQDGTQMDGISFISSDNWYWGAVPYLENKKSEAQGLTLSSSFSADFGFINDIKIGMEYSHNKYLLQRIFYPSDTLILTSRVTGIGFDDTSWTEKRVYENRFPEMWDKYDIFSCYLQDSLNMSDSIVVDLGVRMDSNNMYNNLDTKIYSGGILDTLAPRIGAAWQLDDFVIRGSFARYYDQLWMNMACDMNIAEPEIMRRYTPTDGIDGKNGWTLMDTAYDSKYSGLNTIDDDLVPQYCDEFALSVNWQLSDSMSLSALGAARVYRDLVVEEDLNVDTVYRWRNLTTDAYGSKWKTWEGIVLSFRKRLNTDRFFLNADFVLSREECLTSSDSMYDEYLINPLRRQDNAETWWGISDDPTMRLSLQSFYIFPNDWYTGVTVDWSNGGRYSTKGSEYYQGFGRYDTLPYGRGDIERLPDAFQMNLVFGISSAIELPFSADFLNSDAVIDIQIRINNLTDNQYPLSIGLTQSMPSYMNYTSWNRARWYQLGIRLTL